MSTSTPNKDLPKRGQFARLENNYIIQRQAALKYKIPFMTLYRWAQNPKLIRIKNADGNTVVNEADVAHCTLMHKKCGVERENKPSIMTEHCSSENQRTSHRDSKSHSLPTI